MIRITVSGIMVYSTILLLGGVSLLCAPISAQQQFNELSDMQFNDRQLYLNTTTSYVLAIGAALVLTLGFVALGLYFYDIYATRRSDSGEYNYYAAGPYGQNNAYDYAGYHKR